MCKLSAFISMLLSVLMISVAYAGDCNGNSIEDSCDLSCSNPGCSSVPGCGQSQDCQPNGIPDECDIIGLFAGTQGGGVSGGGKVFIYDGGTSWIDISPNPSWDVAVVMSLTMYGGALHAGTSTGYGFGGGAGTGQVWRYAGGGNWTLLGSLDNSVVAVLVLDNQLFAATNAMKLYRYDSPNWTLVGQASGSGFRSGIVTSVLCGSPELILGELDHDGFWRYTPGTQSGLTNIDDWFGSCIWDFAEYDSAYDDGRLYAGAYFGSCCGDGPVYRSVLPSTCDTDPNDFDRIRSTYGSSQNNCNKT